MYRNFFEVILILAIAFAGCSRAALKDDEEDVAEPKVIEVIKDCEGEFSLKGTKWRLASLIEITGEIKEPTPTDCSECYTMWFDTDYTATVVSIGRRQKLDLNNLWKPDPDWRQRDTIYAIHAGPFICERYIDGIDYCFSGTFSGTIPFIQSYTATCDELIFCYSDTGYLSFVPYNGDIQLETLLAGTRWKLNGVVDVKTGVFNELEPKKCEECYTLEFFGDYLFESRSIWSRQVLDLFNLNLEVDPTRPLYYGEDRPPLYAEEWYDSHYWKGDGNTYEDSYLFRCGIAYTQSYELTDSELKLFFVYQETLYYLTFKCIYQ